MKQLRELAQLRFGLGHPCSEVAASLGIACSTVQEAVKCDHYRRISKQAMKFLGSVLTFVFSISAVSCSANNSVLKISNHSIHKVLNVMANVGGLELKFGDLNENQSKSHIFESRVDSGLIIYFLTSDGNKRRCDLNAYFSLGITVKVDVNIYDDYSCVITKNSNEVTMK